MTSGPAGGGNDRAVAHVTAPPMPGVPARTGKGRRDAAAIRAQRLRAAELFGQGMRQVEVAAALGEATGTVSRWHTIWCGEGSAGLARRNRAGPPGRLTAAQLAAVDAALAAGPQVNGFAATTWTLARAAALIEQVTGVRCSTVTTHVILRERLGWTRQATWVKTRPQSAELPAQVSGAQHAHSPDLRTANCGPPGPVTAGCPLDCLRGVVPDRVLNWRG